MLESEKTKSKITRQFKARILEINPLEVYFFVIQFIHTVVQTCRTGERTNPKVIKEAEKNLNCHLQVIKLLHPILEIYLICIQNIFWLTNVKH